MNILKTQLEEDYFKYEQLRTEIIIFDFAIISGQKQNFQSQPLCRQSNF